MSNFLGGSAYAMARDIADGYHLVTDRTFKKMTPPELDQLGREIDICLREVRGVQPPLDDVLMIQHRNRRIQRLHTAMMQLRSYLQRTRRPA
jgi:hypothetical protein